MTTLEQLALVTLFRGLNAETLADLAAMATALDVAAGTILVEEGTRNDALYVLLEGALRVSLPRSTFRRDPIHLRSAGPGEVLGEYSTFDSDLTSAQVETEVASRLLRIPAVKLKAYLHDRPEAAAQLYSNVIVTLIRRLREKDDELEALQPV